MPASRHVTLFHSPHSRSAGALILLEELGADYELHVLNLKKGEQRQAAYLAINPMGKVPAIVHDGALVTEQGAVFVYLADLYPEAGITPAIGDPLRGPYLRWLFYYGSSFEPALIDRSLKREPAPPSTSPYGDYDTMLKTLTDQLADGPVPARRALHRRRRALGHGAALDDDVQARARVAGRSPAYIARVTSRPAVARARPKIDADLIAAQNAA